MNNKASVIGYYSRINIKSLYPKAEEDDRIFDPEKKFYHNLDSSWLCDPFQDDTTYGVRFSLSSGFSWEFFTLVESAERAEELGTAFLLYLQEKFKGFNGKVSAHPLYSKNLESNLPLYEIVVPSVKIKLHLIRKLISYYNSPQRNLDLELFIFWKRISQKEHIDPRYKIRIFASLKPNGEFLKRKSNWESKGIAVLRYLTSETLMPSCEKREYKRLPNASWKDVFLFNIFPENEMPNSDVTSENVDFIVLPNTPILKSPVLENSNVINVSILRSDPKYIYVGRKVIDGLVTKQVAAIEINALNKHASIYGKTRTGKTKAIENFCNEIRSKRTDVGILNVNLAKPGQEKYYPRARVYSFPSDTYKIPYVINDGGSIKCIRASSHALAACLGLKYVGPVLLSRAFQLCYKETKTFPTKLQDFFKYIEKVLEEDPYDERMQGRLLGALKQRTKELVFESKETASLFSCPSPESMHSSLDWFFRWLEGDFVYLDLSALDNKDQCLATMLILQTIIALGPRGDGDTLTHLVIIDEAHRVIAKSKDKDPESTEFIMSNAINSQFSFIAEECGSRGLGFVIADQKPNDLVDSAVDFSRIKLLFSLGISHEVLFANDNKERILLSNLPTRYALLINGTTGERCLIKTAKVNTDSK